MHVFTYWRNLQTCGRNKKEDRSEDILPKGKRLLVQQSFPGEGKCQSRRENWLTLTKEKRCRGKRRKSGRKNEELNGSKGGLVIAADDRKRKRGGKRIVKKKRHE